MRSPLFVFMISVLLREMDMVDHLQCTLANVHALRVIILGRNFRVGLRDSELFRVIKGVTFGALRCAELLIWASVLQPKRQRRTRLKPIGTDESELRLGGQSSRRNRIAPF